MDFDTHRISVPFHWGADVLAITVVTLAFIVGAAVYIESLTWPAGMLWLKYLLRAIFLITIIAGMGHAPVRLQADDEKITVRKLFESREITLSDVTGVSRISKS